MWNFSAQNADVSDLNPTGEAAVSRRLRFAFCPLDLDVLRAQRIIGFFILIYPQVNEVGKSDHMADIQLEADEFV